MKHLVLKPFIDGSRYLVVGSFFESVEEEKIEQLSKYSFIKVNEKFKPKAKTASKEVGAQNESTSKGKKVVKN